MTAPQATLVPTPSKCGGDDLSQNGPEGNPPDWEIDYAPAESSPPQ